MTYSIIAADLDSGVFGVAIQSHWFNVRHGSPWVRPGVGAVVTQALTDPAYGQHGLDLMERGRDASGALAALLSGNALADRRQVGMIDREGRISCHTGQGCVRYAEHLVGESWAVLGNLLTGPEVIPAMADGFSAATGPLAERLLNALEAGERAGVDLRGSQSAALVVTSSRRGGADDVDISVADHPDPVGELARLLDLDRSYRALTMAQRAIEDGNRQEALAHFARISTRGDVELVFWHAIGLARLGDMDEAVEAMRSILSRQPSLAEVLRRVGERDPGAARLTGKFEIRS